MTPFRWQAPVCPWDGQECQGGQGGQTGAPGGQEESQEGGGGQPQKGDDETNTNKLLQITCWNKVKSKIRLLF